MPSKFRIGRGVVPTSLWKLKGNFRDSRPRFYRIRSYIRSHSQLFIGRRHLTDVEELQGVERKLDVSLPRFYCS